MIALNRLGILPVLFLYMVFPLTYSIAKWGLQHGPYGLYIGTRMVLSATIIILWFLFFKSSHMVIKKKDIHYFILIGIVAFCISFIAECVALPVLPIVKVSLYFALAPFFTAVFAVMHKLEVVSPRKVVGLVVGFCGFVPQLFIDNATGCSSSEFSFGKYDLIMLLASCTYAYGWILVKKLSARTEYHDAWVNGIGMLIGGTCALLYSILFGPGLIESFTVLNWHQFLLSIGLVSVVGIVCYVLYTALLHHFSTTLVSFFSFLEVPFALLFGFIFLQEKIHYLSFVSTAIIAVGLYLFYQEELRLKH